jgi:hypothetical protein
VDNDRKLSLALLKAKIHSLISPDFSDCVLGGIGAYLAKG